MQTNEARNNHHSPLKSDLATTTHTSTAQPLPTALSQSTDSLLHYNLSYIVKQRTSSPLFLSNKTSTTGADNYFDLDLFQPTTPS